MQDHPYDAILLLGGGINLDGSLPDDKKTQVEAAVRLFGEYSPKAFIACGLYSYKAIEKPKLSEARSYADYAVSLGLDPSVIRLEERSQESLGNVLFAKMDLLVPNKWNNILVVPQVNHLTVRVEYLLRKILGPGYNWTIVRANENNSENNVLREAKSLELTKQINDKYADGDHEAIYRGLKETHPAYGGTLHSVEELREKLGS